MFGSMNVIIAAQRACMAPHIQNELKSVTIWQEMFLYKIVTSEDLLAVVALHIFDHFCYNFSLWECEKYGGPEVPKSNFQNSFL